MEEPIRIVCHNYGGSNHNPGCSTPEPALVDLPEKKLVFFALSIAIMELITYGLRQLAFVWANIMLLGGFITNHKPIDFWFVTAILAVEGARLFSRACELQWQQKSTHTLLANTSLHNIQSHSSIPFKLVGIAMRALFISFPSMVPSQMRQLDEGTASSEPTSVGLPSDDPLLPFLPYSSRKIVKTIRRLLYCLHFFPASACAAFSLMRLVQQDYGDEAKKNEKSSINVFYSLALAQAVMFVLEMGYWVWRIEVQELFARVAKEYDFDPKSMGFLIHFFNNVYSKCSEGRFFDILNMDLLSFALGLLDSNSRKEQTIGLTILQQIVQQNTRLTDGLIHKIENSTRVLNLLLEMLKPRNSEENNIRRSAYEIVSKLSYEQYAPLGEANLKAIESLINYDTWRNDERASSPTMFEVFNQGLIILEHLARNQDNCLKITNYPHLLYNIVNLTSSGEKLLCELVPELPEIMTAYHALRVVKTIICAREWKGEYNYRLLGIIEDILYRGKNHSKLQVLGLEILANMAMDSETRRYIEKQSDMLLVILKLFSQLIETEEMGAVFNETVKVLAILIHESTGVCKRMLQAKENEVRKLVDVFDNSTLNLTLRVNAACILRDLCANSAPSEYGTCATSRELGTVLPRVNSVHVVPQAKSVPALPRVKSICSLPRPNSVPALSRANSVPALWPMNSVLALPRVNSLLQIVAQVMPKVLKRIMEEEEEKLLEVSIELASQILKFRNCQINGNEIRRAGVKDENFVQKLVEMLKRYENPDIKVPRMRTSLIKLAITLMKYEHKYIELFRNFGVEDVLMRTAETKAEFERYRVFSWSKLRWFEVNISISVDVAISGLSEERDSKGGMEDPIISYMCKT